MRARSEAALNCPFLASSIVSFASMSVAASLRIGEPELRQQGLESRRNISKLVGVKHPGLSVQRPNRHDVLRLVFQARARQVSQASAPAFWLLLADDEKTLRRIGKLGNAN